MKHEVSLSRFQLGQGPIAIVADAASPLGPGASRVELPSSGGTVILDLSEADRLALAGASHVVLDLYHEMSYTLGLSMRFAEQTGAQTADGAGAIQATLGVLPGLVTRLSFPTAALDAQTVFLPRTPGRLKGTCFGSKVHPDRVATLALGVGEADAPQICWIRALHFSDSEPDYPVAPKPVVDELGQWTAKDWPGKTASTQELTGDMARYLAESETGAYPDGWSKFGGWTGKRFRSTGFFRTENDGRRWWLVDPDGYAFFSSGVDCVGPQAECSVEGNEGLFTWLPPTEGEFAEAWSGNPSRGGQFSFSIANAVRAWGSDWYTNWAQMTAGRLRAWGFNTIANWSDARLCRSAAIPYTLQLNSFPTTVKKVFRDFPDVFSPEYLEAARACAEQLSEFKGDSYLIGYFLRNEPVWAFGENNLAEHLVESGGELHSCRSLLDFLRERYQGDAARLSEAWGHQFDSFEGIVGTPGASRLSTVAKDDLWAFTAVLVRQYLAPVCEACRLVDPSHLNLGMRYAWLSSEACLSGSDLFDVFSINMYQMGPDAEVIRRASEASGLPVMIGEYHWGALDRGLPSTGLRGVPSQEERAIAFQWYMETGASMPSLVGAHYFQLNDQPVMGRFDGENFQIGLVDVCHRPYTELLSAARRAHEHMYYVADDQVTLVARAPIEAPRQGF